MKVVILCGGFGTRLRDVSEHLPKPLVPVGERPILWHIMKGYSHFGFRDFVLCLGYQSWQIKQFFLNYRLSQTDFTLGLGEPQRLEHHGDDACEDWNITFAETGLNSMTGCRLKRVEKYIGGGEHFMLTYGDGVADVDIPALLEFHESHDRLGTVTAVRPPGRFGEIELADGRVAEFNEKPNVSRGRINGGFFVFRRAFLDRLADDPSLVLEQSPLIDLARDGELAAYEHDGFWQPMDTGRDHRLLNDMWASGNAPWRTWDAQPVAVGGPADDEPEAALPRKSR